MDPLDCAQESFRPHVRASVAAYVSHVAVYNPKVDLGRAKIAVGVAVVSMATMVVMLGCILTVRDSDVYAVVLIVAAFLTGVSVALSRELFSRAARRTRSTQVRGTEGAFR